LSEAIFLKRERERKIEREKERVSGI